MSKSHQEPSRAIKSHQEPSLCIPTYCPTRCPTHCHVFHKLRPSSMGAVDPWQLRWRQQVSWWDEADQQWRRQFLIGCQDVRHLEILEHGSHVLKHVFETCFPHFPTRPMDKSRPDQSELKVWRFLMCWQCFSALVRSGKCRWDDLILWRRLLSSAAERILASWNQLEQGDSCPRDPKGIETWGDIVETWNATVTLNHHESS